jgi:hypothetical protein
VGLSAQGLKGHLGRGFQDIEQIAVLGDPMLVHVLRAKVWDKLVNQSGGRDLTETLDCLRRQSKFVSVTQHLLGGHLVPHHPWDGDPNTTGSQFADHVCLEAAGRKETDSVGIKDDQSASRT